ncbi:MAG: prepilin-type N-terminal cleavage/methylation domain-containing protein [Rhizobiales bacterium]|nr:prepilin-type N-terminal cleavage/methylation domain-containing protein [Hyphomicrobiales bacterium]
MRRGRHHGTAGFTLLEVLVALAIVAVSLSAIGALVATNARGTRALDQRLALTASARAVLADLTLRDDLSSGRLSGEVAGHRWRADVKSLPVAPRDARQPPPWLPQEVTLQVEAPDGQSLRLDTIRLRRNADAAR